MSLQKSTYKKVNPIKSDIKNEEKDFNQCFIDNHYTWYGTNCVSKWMVATIFQAPTD